MVTVAKSEQAGTGFGVKLRALRLAAGLTQQELADRVGTNTVGLSRLENGAVLPSWDTAVRIAAALGVSLDEFRIETTGDPAVQMPARPISKRK